MQQVKIIDQARDVLRIEAEGILKLMEKLDESFVQAVEVIARSKGRVIVTGIGKSGLIGRKIVATLTSTGTQAIFLHPVEGIHGDLGIVTREDVLIAISNSGETEELNVLLTSIKKIGAPIIALTGNLSSSLAGNADISINVGVEREACPFGLAPTASTTAALAVGDALAVSLIYAKGFKETDFYKFHPGGTLGLRLKARVRDVMIAGEMIPRVTSGESAFRAIEEMDRKNKGFVLITGSDNRLLGILTDGDVRRLARKRQPLDDLTVDEVMTKNPKTIAEDTSLARTIESMQQEEITTLAVTGDGRELRGYVHLHDILGRGGTVRIVANSL